MTARSDPKGFTPGSCNVGALEEEDPVRIGLRLGLGAALITGLIWPLASSGQALAYTAVPAHVLAPYYETCLAPNTPSLTATEQASGAKYFTLASCRRPGRLLQSWLERLGAAATELLRR